MSIEQPVTILFKGGRLQSWYQLSPEQKSSFEQEHVDLMLSIAKQHHLHRLEGYRLIAPQGGWERFWIIEFPSLSGAEAWIDAEMTPPYGRYGFYNYQMARQTVLAPHPGWLPASRPNPIAWHGDPHQVPELSIDRDSVVVFMYEWDRLGSGLTPNETSTFLSRAEKFDALWLEQFYLIAPQAKWNRAWLVELSTLDSAEAWIEAEAAAGQADTMKRHYQLTRKWAPSYFVNWIPR